MKVALLSVLSLLIIMVAACTSQPESIVIPDRESLIPAGIEKVTPAEDSHPPVSMSDEFEQPVPLQYPINTRGAEDSAFILPDGETLYFWFTPDPLKDAALQAQDMVTGIYVSYLMEGEWSEPARIWLSEPGTSVLDGCGFFTPETMWFCTVREGLEGMHWFTAQDSAGEWVNWQQADFDSSFVVGEFHIVGDRFYYHSSRTGGLGGLDVWMLTRNPDGTWGNPENVTAVNSERDEGWPAISPDGTELWINRDYGLWRSQRINDAWSEPVLMISPLAGEASLDNDGNVYFTHHFYDANGEHMLEADIYVAYRK